MTSNRVLLLSAPLALALTVATRTARADDTVSVGAGLIGALGGNFLDKADRDALDPDIYPGFSGATVGGGLLLDLRFVNLIGVEIDVIRSSDRGSGTVTLNGFDYDVTIGQSSWHVPILAKLTLGSSIVVPTFFAGPELVFVGEPEAEVDGPGATAALVTAQADDYVMLTFGGGIEIQLPLPVIDLRVPLTLRGSYNPSVPSDFDDRLEFTASGVRVDSEWKYAVLFTAGAALYF